MTAEQMLQLASLVVSLLVGIGGGFAGAYIGMRVGIAQLETWRGIFEKALDEAKGSLTLLNEDSVIHDTELGYVMEHLKMQRARRQRFRD